MHLPPVTIETHHLAYTDRNGFTRTLAAASRADLERSLERMILKGEATLIGARFTVTTEYQASEAA